MKLCVCMTNGWKNFVKTITRLINRSRDWKRLTMRLKCCQKTKQICNTIFKSKWSIGKS